MKTPHMITLLILLFVNLLNAEYQLVEHPRILVNKEILPGLAERAVSGGLAGEDYAVIKSEADRVVEQGIADRAANEVGFHGGSVPLTLRCVMGLGPPH